MLLQCQLTREGRAIFRYGHQPLKLSEDLHGVTALTRQHSRVAGKA